MAGTNRGSIQSAGRTRRRAFSAPAPWMSALFRLGGSFSEFRCRHAEGRGRDRIPQARAVRAAGAAAFDAYHGREGQPLAAPGDSQRVQDAPPGRRITSTQRGSRSSRPRNSEGGTRCRIRTKSNRRMNELALFAGAGGGILGGHLLGWRTVCAVELNPYARRVLLARQRDGILPRFPIWDDVRTFDGKPWRGRVDVISGGFPCQDISAAGKGEGITGERSGLWAEMARIVGEVRPRFALVENSPVLTSRGLGTVLGDLAALGYNARWGVLSAADAIWLGGTPCLDHLRERIWIAAADSSRVQQGWEIERAEWQRTRPGRESNAEHQGERCGQGRSGRSDSGGEREREQAFCANADASCGRCGEPEGGEDQQPGRAETLSAGSQNSDRDGAGLEEQRGGAVNTFGTRFRSMQW
jgi:DNA (cytosine-5)-methyltransferase 1